MELGPRRDTPLTKYHRVPRDPPVVAWVGAAPIASPNRCADSYMKKYEYITDVKPARELCTGWRR